MLNKISILKNLLCMQFFPDDSFRDKTHKKVKNKRIK